jgi:hypothetical protein
LEADEEWDKRERETHRRRTYLHSHGTEFLIKKRKKTKRNKTFILRINMNNKTLKDSH